MASRLTPILAAGLAVLTILLLAAEVPGLRPVVAGDPPKAPQEALKTGAAPADAAESPEEDPLGPNGACYVCHMAFVKEELAKTHKAEKVYCVKCHGLSDKHANDEHIGATKPDITYPRDKVDASCLKCHETHDAPARLVVARFLQRGISPKTAPVCTDCHGTHKIEQSAEAR